jgi:hypothetical protein
MSARRNGAWINCSRSPIMKTTSLAFASPIDRDALWEDAILPAVLK